MRSAGLEGKASGYWKVKPLPQCANAWTAAHCGKRVDDDVLNSPTFRVLSACGTLRLMKLRLLANCLVLALFVMATTLAAFVSPATAGYGRPDAVEAAMTMDVDMPCCPPDQGKAKDCTTSCPALSFCLAKSFVSEPTAFVTLIQPVVAALGLSGDDSARASRPFEPPARPPRS